MRRPARHHRNGRAHPTTTLIPALLVAVLLVLGPPLRAQRPSPTIGITGGVDLGMLRTSVPVFAGSSDCGTFSDGTIVSGWTGAVASFPSLFSSAFGLRARIAWSTSTARLVATPVDPLVIFDPERHRSVTVPDEYRLVSTVHAVRLELTPSLRLGDRWGMTLGPWGEYLLASDFSQADAITDGVHRFEGGSAERAMTDGTRLTPTTFGGGIVVGATYAVPLGRRLLLTPDLTIRTALSSRVREVSWNDVAVGVGLGIDFELSETEPPSGNTPPIAEDGIDSSQQDSPVRTISPSNEIVPFDSAQTTPRLYAALNLYSIDSAGHKLPEATIAVTERVERERSPLGDAIAWEDESAGTFLRRLTPSEVALFTPDSLFGLTTSEFETGRANVLGYRLRRDTGATLGISLREPTTPGGLRTASALRDYLIDAWNIESDRIVLTTGDSTTVGDGNHFVLLLSSSSPDILAPIVAERIERTIVPPLISVKPSFRSSAGISDWRITLSQNGNTLGTYSSDGGSTDRLEWRIAGNETELAPLVATMVVADSAGNSATVSTHIPLSIRRRSSLRYRSAEPEEGRVRTLLVSPPNPSRAEVRGLLDDADAAANRESTIVIVDPNTPGFDRDEDLATLRTMLKERGATGVSIATGAEERSLLSDLPAGSRGALRIVVVQRLSQEQ